jgi:hypothetical protein
MDKCAICDGQFDGGAVLQHRETDEIHLICKSAWTVIARPTVTKNLMSCPECGSDCVGRSMCIDTAMGCARRHQRRH